jgi:hypothetical protein
VYLAGARDVNSGLREVEIVLQPPALQELALLEKVIAGFSQLP